MIILSLIPLFTLPANALSGSWTKDFVTGVGKSTYTLTLDSPDEVSSSSNWTIIATLSIDHMDRFKTFVFFTSMFITVETDNGEQMKKTLQFGHYPIGEFPDRLYPGSRWGPHNVTFNLAEEDIGIPLGGSVDANIYVTVNIAEFLYQPFRAEQLPQTTYETYALNAGAVKITSEGSTLGRYLPYILGVVVSAIIFAGLFAWDRFTKRKTP